MEATSALPVIAEDSTNVSLQSNVLSNSYYGGDGAFPFIIEQPTGVTVSRGTQAATFFIHLFLSVSLFALFVTFLFFVITTQVEQSTVERNLNRVVRELTVDATSTLSETEKAEIFTFLDQNANPPDLRQEDEEVASQNRSLINRTLVVIFSVFGVALFIMFLLWGLMRFRAMRNKGSEAISGADYPNIRHIVIEDFVLLGFVAVTELLFLFGIAGNFRSLDANEIRRTVLDTIKNFVEEE